MDAYGVDISEHAINSVYRPIQNNYKVASITDPLDNLYDAIISIDVVEHMEKSKSEIAIANLCKHTDKIFFSSSRNDYSDVTNLNVQQPEVWAQIFARNGIFLRFGL